MRENPNASREDPSEQFFVGDNAKRNTGETLGFERLTSHAMEAFGQGQEIHMQAALSQAELLYKQFREKKEKLTGNTRAAIMDKYGDAASKEKPPDGLLMGQTEKYVEYDRAGRVVKRWNLPSPSLGDEEDVPEQNHKAVGLGGPRAVWVRVLSQHPARELPHRRQGYRSRRGVRESRPRKFGGQGKLRWRRRRRAAAKGGGARGEKRRTSFGAKATVGGEGGGRGRQPEPRETDGGAAKGRQAVARDERGRDGEEARVQRTRTRRRNPQRRRWRRPRRKPQRKEDPMAAPDGGTEGYDLV